MSKKAAQKRELKRKIIRLTDGLFSSAIDLTLFCFFAGGEAFAKAAFKRPTYQPDLTETEKLLSQINWQTIKNAINHLKKMGLLKSIQHSLLAVEITRAGLEKLSKQLPRYKTRRPWDKMIYLVSYDIERDKNWYRDRLRHLLLSVGATRIHDSLYITPYNPKGILKQFVKENGSHGNILISMLTKDSQIGENPDIKELLWEYYGMEEINLSYKNFILAYQGEKKGQVSPIQVAMDFLAIVKKDPQLPFELLPAKYLGDKAYLLYHRLTKEYRG